MKRALLAIVSSLLLPLACRAQAKPVAFADFGRAFLAEQKESEPPALPDLLDRHYARLLLADFDLRVPSSLLANGKEVVRIATIAGVLLDLQEHLAEWAAPTPAATKAQLAELATLRKYLAAWRNKPTTTEPPAVAARSEPCVLLLAPDRKNFVGLVGWLGLWKKNYEECWWSDATAQFSDLRLQDEGHVQIVALEYAAPNQNGDVTLGFDMNTREKTGLLQHVLQRAALAWCWRWLGDDADPTFVAGFSTDLVIDVLGQNNARSGGSGKSKSTDGRNAFIPGAPGRGGSMEMVNADSSWRLGLGQDYFARVLRQAQKAGEHEATDGGKDKVGNFLLRDAKGERKHLVTAPFLGAVAYAREAIPEPFLDDYLEFFRAYRAAFVHWLQVEGGKAKGASKTASSERFQALLQKLVENKEAPFEDVCQQVYGLALSSKTATADTLERRFLTWIAEKSR